MKAVEPIMVTDLFPGLYAELLALLRSLSDADWNKPTAAREWTVKDIAAHLLDTDIRRLSFQRDQFPLQPPEAPINGYSDLVAFLNRLNTEWVRAAKRISPRLLVSLLELTGPQVCDLLKSLDPHGTALFSVAWAGEDRSANWFDIAREYTEKWHHQQQIRDAVGASGLTQRKWLYPVLDTFLRGLPHTYRDVDAAEATAIVVEITGEAGGHWCLVREAGSWKLYEGDASEISCRITMDQDAAWRLLTKGLEREQAERRIVIEGERRLGEPILSMLAVMA